MPRAVRFDASGPRMVASGASMSAQQDKKVVILGGGLTGISAALFLRQPWVLFEKNARLGGHARTDEKDGYRFDKTGHWLHLRDDGVKSLVNEILPGSMQSVSRVARIFSNGVLTRYPFQANLHGLPPDVVKECLMGVIEAKQRSAAAGDEPDPKNFEEYCLRHFGAGISKHFMIPYNERLWGVSPKEITAAWCSRFVPLPNLEQIVSGAVGAGPAEMGYNVSFAYPKKGGIESFTRGLIGRMSGGVAHTETTPDEIDYQARTVRVGDEVFPYSALVATIPLPELLKRMRNLPPDIEAHAANLRCTTLRYLNVGTKTPSPADWHWIYVPEKRYPFYRVGIFTNAMASMAPQGKASLYVELADRASISDLDATTRDVALGLAEAGAIGGAHDIAFAEPKFLEYAYVVFDDNYYPATSAIFRFLERNGIYPRGRYGSWTYNAMEDCVIAGREVAATIDAISGPQPTE